MSLSTHKVEVVEINLEKHPNAELLSIVKIFGYQVVVRTDDWKDKNLGAYIPPDSLVCTDRPEFTFLKTDGRNIERIKVKKLRGIISMGLLVPAPIGSYVGDDVAVELGVEHYEPPLPTMTGGDNSKGPPLAYAPKYDVDTIRKYNRLLVDGEKVYVSEKIHGCLHKDTLVTLIDGSTKSISNIVIGDVVQTYQGESVVSNVFVDDDDKVEWLELEFNGGQKLVCTENHKILTNIGWVEAKDITNQHEIISI